MKRLLIISALALNALAATAQDYRLQATDQQGNTRSFTQGFTTVSVLDNQGLLINDSTYYAPGSLRNLLMLRDGVRWNATFKETDANRHNWWGYGSIMHIRDLMTADMAGSDTGYNWYKPWEQNTYQGKTSATTSTSGRYGQYEAIFNYNVLVNETLHNLLLDINDAIAHLGTATTLSRGLTGAALAERAMLYLDMARMYESLPNEKFQPISSTGQDLTGLTVPIIDENTQPLSTDDDIDQFIYVPRATKQQMVAFIENDLDRAETLIGDLAETSKVLPHLDVIYGLKARLYLWAEDYAKAEQYARRAIETSSLQPMTADDMTNVRTGFNDLSKWMWGVQYFSDDESVQTSIVNWTSWLSPEYQGYANISPLSISRSLYDRISPTDVRRRLFVSPDSYAQSDSTSTQTSGPQLLVSGLNPYTAVKFRPGNGDIENCVTAYPLMRVEEMYFIEAEAALQQGKADEALMRLYSFMHGWRDANYSFASTEPSDLLDEIILQKRIELWGEGQTFFDVKRLNLSVVRDYEGTNFYPAAAINTVGRPVWMNFVFSSAWETYNIGLNGYNNPDPSNMQTVQPISEDEARSLIKGDVVLHELRFTDYIDVLPIDSIYGFVFRFDLPIDSTGAGMSFSFQVSLSPEFETDRTIETYSVGESHYDYFTYEPDAESINEHLLQLLRQTDRTTEQPTDVYMRVQAQPRACQTLMFTSNTVSFRAKVSDHYKHQYGYSKAPRTHITPAASLIDYEDFNFQQGIKIVNIHNEDNIDFYSATIYLKNTETLLADEDVITADGYAQSYLQNSWEMDYTTYPGPLSYMAYVNQRLTRDELAFISRSDTVSLTVTPNRQAFRERAFNWQSYDNNWQLQSEYLGTRKNISIERSADGRAYRLLYPYENNGYAGRNLIIYADPQDRALTVPKQYAHTGTDGHRICVSGRGIHDSEGIFTLQLDFMTANGDTILQTCTERIGTEEQLINWQLTEEGNYTWNNSYLWGTFNNYYTTTTSSDGQTAYIDLYNAFEDVNVRLTLNPADNTVSLEPTFTGYTHPTYGDIYARSYEDDGISTYDPATGQVQLYIIYYVDAGYFFRGAETIQLGDIDVPQTPQHAYLYIPNSANGWNPETAPMIMGDYGSGNYSGYAYLGDELKFTYERNWEQGECNASSFTSYPAGFGGYEQGNITNATPGYYYLDVTPGGDFRATLISSVSIVGSFGDWDNDIELDYNAEDESWSAVVTLPECEWKFRMNHAWELNLGGFDNYTFFDGTNNPYSDLQPNGANLIISQAGTYRITLHASLFDSEYMYCTVENAETAQATTRATTRAKIHNLVLKKYQTKKHTTK